MVIKKRAIVIPTPFVLWLAKSRTLAPPLPRQPKGDVRQLKSCNGNGYRARAVCGGWGACARNVWGSLLRASQAYRVLKKARNDRQRTLDLMYV